MWSIGGTMDKEKEKKLLAKILGQELSEEQIKNLQDWNEEEEDGKE